MCPTHFNHEPRVFEVFVGFDRSERTFVIERVLQGRILHPEVEVGLGSVEGQQLLNVAISRADDNASLLGGALELPANNGLQIVGDGLVDTPGHSKYEMRFVIIVAVLIYPLAAPRDALVADVVGEGDRHSLVLELRMSRWIAEQNADQRVVLRPGQLELEPLRNRNGRPLFGKGGELLQDVDERLFVGRRVAGGRRRRSRLIGGEEIVTAGGG
ncbi:hypothetical protein PG995_005200 [Apiospora arundinis]